jgi:hypothetical protein
MSVAAISSTSTAMPSTPSSARSATSDAITRSWRSSEANSRSFFARPKLGLANELGLAGAGFWALGYERGLRDYTDLIADFRAGRSMTVAIAP